VNIQKFEARQTLVYDAQGFQKLMVRIRDLRWISREDCTLDGCPTHRLAIFSKWYMSESIHT